MAHVFGALSNQTALSSLPKTFSVQQGKAFSTRLHRHRQKKNQTSEGKPFYQKAHQLKNFNGSIKQPESLVPNGTIKKDTAEGMVISVLEGKKNELIDFRNRVMSRASIDYGSNHLRCPGKENIDKNTSCSAWFDLEAYEFGGWLYISASGYLNRPTGFWLNKKADKIIVIPAGPVLESLPGPLPKPLYKHHEEVNLGPPN
jgi:hypothetical protein